MSPLHYSCNQERVRRSTAKVSAFLVVGAACLILTPVASASYWRADYEFNSASAATARFEYVYEGADGARLRGNADIDRNAVVSQQERMVVETQLREHLAVGSFEYLDGQPALERRVVGLRMYDLEGPLYDYAQPKPVEIRSSFALSFELHDQASHEFVVNMSVLPNGTIDFTAPPGQIITEVEGLDPKRAKGDRDVEGNYASDPLRILWRYQAAEATSGASLIVFAAAVLALAIMRRQP